MKLAVDRKTAKLFYDGAGFCLRAIIWVYRHSLSLLLGRQCRFLPTCSAYADEAIRVHGPARGVVLAFRRVSRCHPWGGHGFDPVPEAENKG